MIQKIPSDIELFNDYISKTDDCQYTSMEETVYPLNAEGRPDYSSADKKIVTQPAWKQWKLPEEQSRQWSLFRKRNDELYSTYCSAAGEEKKRLEELLTKNIADCIAYAIEHRIQDFLAASGYITLIQLEIFNLKQDILEFKTPLRTITLKYEKQIPLSDFEKEFLDKYVLMHNEVPLRTLDLCHKIKEQRDLIPGLWAKIPITKEKADKATNSIYLPPPEMKGDWSAGVQFTMPTLEESQQHVNDFNQYMGEFSEEVNKLCDNSNMLYAQVYEEEEYIDTEDGEEEEQPQTLFAEVEEMVDLMLQDWDKYSMDASVLYQDFDNFKGAWNPENKKILAAWDDFCKEDNVFMDVYNEFVGLLNEKFNPAEQNTEAAPGISPISDETDDLRTETIKRYESGTSPYFDIDDWHIILDNFEQKYDVKNKAIALEKAFAQHPQNSTLLLRKAQEEAGKHEYQKALAFVKQAEAQGPLLHPNFYNIKASIYCQMHAPEQAVPLYNKLINSKGEGLEWYQKNARLRLIDIYNEQKKYPECIRLSKELLEKNPDEEDITAKLCFFYRSSGMLKEAEETAKLFLQKFPKSSVCMEQLGHLYIETGEYEKAAEQFENSYAVNKNENYGNLCHKGKALQHLKRFKEAAVCFETCIFYYHLDKNYHLGAAQCYTELKMPYAAIYHYRKVLALDPECTEALQQLQALNTPASGQSNIRN